MRPHFLTSALLLLAGCTDSLPAKPPPSNSFAFPSAVVHLPSPGGNGTLFVASSNFDKFYDSGAVLAVDLDSAGAGGTLAEALPTFGSPPPAEVREILLRVPDDSIRYIQSISGEMALYTPQAGGAPYLFVPSRAEGDLLQVIRANGAKGATLECVGSQSRRCFDRAISLTESAGLPDGLPGAPGPIGVTVGQAPGQAPELWATHISAALPPSGDDRSAAASTFVVKANPDEIIAQLEDAGQGAPLQLPPENFVLLDRGHNPLAGAHSVALGPDFAFLSGRSVANAPGNNLPFLLRGMKRSDPTIFADPNLRGAYPNVEGRGVALNAAGTRLYLAARATGSTLLVANVQTSATQLEVTVVRAIDTLPPGASAVRVLSRGPGRGDLVLVTCTAAGVLAIYDDEVGDIVAQVQELGDQPYALAVDARPNAAGGLGARVYVANFGDGQVSVIDINDLNSPQNAFVVARLGNLQRCAGDQADDDDCSEAAP